jgi:hypothetical protein
MNPTKKSPGASQTALSIIRKPAHAPQIKPVVAQLKTGMPAQSGKRPVAPPVYQPKQAPKIVQRKIVNLVRPITAKRTASTFSAIQMAMAAAIDIYEAYHTFIIDGVTYKMNWALGDTNKKGEPIYHVTKHGRPKKHYFFTLKDKQVIDSVAPKGFSGRESYMFSKLPAAVQQYVRTNV